MITSGGLIRFGFLLGLGGLLFVSSGCSAKRAVFEGPSTTLGACSPTPCVKIFMEELPKLPVDLSESAKNKIEGQVASVLYASLDIDTGVFTRESVLQGIENRFQEFATETDAPIDWSLRRSARTLAETPQVIALEVESEGYLGGAHGFHDRTLMTFDPASGERLGVSDVIEERSRGVLTRIVEAEFRRVRNVPQSQTLQEAGFFIMPGQEMPLAENFALTGKGLELQYNPYEVAPYSMGDTRLVIPREAIEPLLKEKVRGVFAALSSGDTRGAS